MDINEIVKIENVDRIIQIEAQHRNFFGSVT